MRPPQPQLSWQQLRQDGVGSGGAPGPRAGDGLGVLHLPHRLPPGSSLHHLHHGLQGREDAGFQLGEDKDTGNSHLEGHRVRAGNQANAGFPWTEDGDWPVCRPTSAHPEEVSQVGGPRPVASLAPMDNDHLRPSHHGHPPVHGLTSLHLVPLGPGEKLESFLSAGHRGRSSRTNGAASTYHGKAHSFPLIYCTYFYGPL